MDWHGHRVTGKPIGMVEMSAKYKNTGKKLNFYKVPIANKGLDVRDDVAARIYDIRCKIVHTKDDEHQLGHGMILPFSEEADELELDNVLLEFVAQKVLISSSVPIRFAG
jgi:hypothetical protein